MNGVKSSAKFETALDAKGKEVRGEEAKKAVRDAYANLGIEDLHDAKFNVEFARQTRLYVRRMAAERIMQDELDSQFSLKEVHGVLKLLKAGKASGCDEILVEWLKFGGERMTYALWVLCNMVWASEKCPAEWSKGVITLLYKDGDRRDPLNYRGITLLSVVGKVFMHMVNARLATFCEGNDLLVDEQAGFRKGRSCADQLFILTDVLAKHRQEGKKLMACFIDIRKAYDRVWRDGLWKALWQKGVRGRMWRVLKGYYKKVQSAVRLEGGNTDWFDVDVGVRQGCVISPMLFDVFVDQLAREVRALKLGVAAADGRLSLLLYADDIVLMADSQKDLQRMLGAVQAFFRRWRLQVNMSKPKVMAFGVSSVNNLQIE